MIDITVTELKEKMDNGESIILIDVREPYEYELSNLGGRLIPLSLLPAALEELAGTKEEEIIVHCKSGGRSAKAAAFMRQQGFKNVRNLLGGILDWKNKIDPRLPI
jgi:adenylyltransferase/sulfurtransferase